MKFLCITPTLNSGGLIEKTLKSVLNQSLLEDPQNSLEYIIMDAKSSDKTSAIIDKIVKQYKPFKNILITFKSEPDTGMYDALSKGFKLANKADYYSYLNAGDYYSPQAFEIAAEIFQKKQVHFLTGLNTLYNEKNHIIESFLPFHYSTRLIEKGFYGTKLPFIQQESTFWDYKAHKCINLEKLSEFQFAGDFFIWTSLIKNFQIYIVSAWLGGFKIHMNQLSVIRHNEYKREFKDISQASNLWDNFLFFLYRVIHFLPMTLKAKLSPTTFIFNHKTQKYQL